MNQTEWLHAIYEKVGGNLDNPQALTAAAIALDDEQAMVYQAEAFGRRLRSDLRGLERKMLREVVESPEPATPLPGMDYEPTMVKRMRQVIVVDGVTYDTGSLAGQVGAEVLSRWASQIRKGAVTTLEHARLAERTAAALVEASAAAGRDVSAAEVWGWEQAA